MLLCFMCLERDESCGHQDWEYDFALDCEVDQETWRLVLAFFSTFIFVHRFLLFGLLLFLIGLFQIGFLENRLLRLLQAMKDANFLGSGISFPPWFAK